MLRTVKAIRYVTPLREGGSLPAIVEADDDGTYVLKFRGAGQGPKSLIAELIAGEIGRALGLAVPEIVFVDLDPSLGRSEPDPDIHDLIMSSAGLNLALDYLPGSLAFDRLAARNVDPTLAAEIVWFDAYVTNVDRTARNTNMLLWGNRVWLIDHGAALYFHHTWTDYLARSESPFPLIKDHVLLPLAGDIAAVGADLARRVDATLIESIVDAIPDLWLDAAAPFPTLADQRRAYATYLTRRLAAAHRFVEVASRARAALV